MNAARGAKLPTFFQRASKPLRIKGVSLFHIFYSPENLIPYIAARYLNDFDHPIRPKVVHMYQTRERGILWWTVVDGYLVSSLKPVVRSWCARRVRTAFEAVLKERGYNTEGKKLIRDSQGHVTGAEKALKGTMEIRMVEPVMKAGYEKIVEQARLLVDHLENKQVWEGKRNQQQAQTRQTRGPEQKARGKRPSNMHWRKT
ncbi:uncharacterized protein CIMG_08675 [Coccidioides immitis RS]|uniref:Uncharacterized protein n=2 Tax=Coccidioides immitis TaxID=5501 RepID=J3K602_COCIM|nr:uncharacterized protein CIMG_08675 [Coccidioides immitis RS]EAS29929.3 hypothetical protein CIMG_08675 [Coccidioides immitis RS]KMP06912.1 hypothetical protein CIRG_06593 [Coccidioides immitis RMSCC 2394]TPX22229.1 hypothetical protein DIZ76_014095 [Coccidioides immitis]